MLVETQYRVVGTNNQTSRVTWHDTSEEAIEHAMSYQKAVVKRPDGSLIGEYFGREVVPDAFDYRGALRLMAAYRAHRGKFSQACDLEAELDEALSANNR